MSTTLPKHGPAPGCQFFLHHTSHPTHISIFVSVLTGDYYSESIIDQAKSSANQARQYDSQEIFRSVLRDMTQDMQQFKFGGTTTGGKNEKKHFFYQEVTDNVRHTKASIKIWTMWMIHNVPFRSFSSKSVLVFQKGLVRTCRPVFLNVASSAVVEIHLIFFIKVWTSISVLLRHSNLPSSG